MKQNSKIKMGSNRSFGLIFFAVLITIAFWSYRGEFQQIKTIPFYFSLIFLVLGLMNSKLLTPLNKLWFKFGLLLGAFISPIIMGIIFFAVVTPIGIFMKIMNKDLLRNKSDKNVRSYWINRGKQASKMKQQF
tara:strand:+ start:148 stop:546 length:399 start_codon:yes stop_codon:yes gene_type:complete